ncbi:ATP-dependent translocase ABCB1-like [Physella acuta]|uniref:ATP-dependent translocase ABCB1-like n=1 Tax=Physella acuta TaxID=109671 RepID=UPI0027DC1124|nr:ATP-dependent translocase ABCB1-like [Physella acuta]
MIAGFLQIYLFILSSERQIIRMRLAFFQNVMKQELSWFDSHSAGEISVKLTDDISKIHDAIGDKGGTALQWFSSFLGGAIISYIFGWELTLILQISSPILFLSAGTIGYFFSTMTAKERVAYSKAGTVAEEVLSSIRTVHAFGGQDKEAKRYIASLSDARKFGIRKSLMGGLGQGMMWFIIFCNWALGFWYGGRLVRHGDYEVKDMMTVFFTTFISCLSLGLAAPSIVTINVGRGAAYDVFRLIDRISNIDSSSTEGLKPATITGRIQVQNVHFNYPSRDSVKILNGLDLTINPGQTVALVGSSGCGKSTLIQLLLRFYDPNIGKITLDDIDIRDMNVKWLRRSIGLVGQEPVLFATTILENIRYGNGMVSMEEIVQACKNANAYDFIMNLPERFDTHVGERGAQLSGGQKQRIAIARALVKNPRILLLDEATSALDNQSEAVVQDALEKASKGRSTIVIAHRLSTVRQADVIVVLDKGRVQEKGTHDQLMAKKGFYFTLVSSQLRKQESESGGDSDTNTTVAKPLEISVGNYGDQVLKMAYVEDELDLSASSLSTIGRLLKMNSPEWFFLVLGSLSSLTNGALQPAWAIILSEVIKAFSKDDLQDQKDTMRDMSLYSLGVAFASLITFFLQDYMFGLSGEALTMRIRDLLFRSILRKNIAWFDDHRHETGILSTQLAVEASVVQGVVKTLVGSILLSVGNLGTGFVISLIFGWQLALALAAFIPFMILSGGLMVATVRGGLMVATVRGGLMVATVRGGLMVATVRGGLMVATVRGGLMVATYSGGLMVATVRGGLMVATYSGGLMVATVRGGLMVATVRGGLMVATVRGGLMVATVRGGLMVATVRGGLMVATYSGGLMVATVRGGLMVATVRGGLMVATVRGGLMVATVRGGLMVATVRGGLMVATVRGGLMVATVSGGLMVATVRGGLMVATVIGGLMVATIIGGLMVAKVRGGLMVGVLSVAFLGGAAKENKKAMEDACKNALSCVDNIRTVAALTKEGTFYRIFSADLMRPVKSNLKRAGLASAAFGVSGGMYFFTYAVAFYYGSKLLEDDDIDFNDIFKVFGCLVLGSMQLGRAVAFAPDTSAAISAARRIFAIHDQTPPIDAYSLDGEAPLKSEFNSTIRFSKTFFRYPMRPDVSVLNGLDLVVEPGQTLALVGESGCGKSTIVQLIERFYDPDQGAVFMDKYDVKDLNVQWLRAQIGLVSQEPILFATSIAENIAYGDNSRNCSMEEIVKAAKAANIHSFIISLPQGYQTNVGSKGTQLSGGQKQRIAIARALIRNPNILLLDEATSALDAESEKVVQEALDKARQGRTCITIAHRLSTIKDAQKIAVFKGGVVQEIGTHTQLMSNRGPYYKLITSNM